MRRFCLISAVALAVIQGTTLLARAAPQDATNTKPPTAVTVAPTLGVPTVDDLTMLRKASDAVRRTPFLLTSDLKVKGTGGGVVLLINETVRVTGTFPGKFRSEVVLLDEDGKTPAAKFQVIGDGKKVYTYCPDTKQYAAQTVEAFQKDFAMPVIGVVCGLIASGDSSYPDDLPLDAAGVAAYLGALKNGGLILESGPGSDGQRLIVMRSIASDTNGFEARMTISPVTGGFVGMQLSGRQGEWKFVITETVRSMAKMPASETFTFTPPAGVQKVPKLSVWPF